MVRALWSGNWQHSPEYGWHMEARPSKGPTAEIDEGRENVSPERGVERMNSNFDAKLWEVLEKGKMADLSQFRPTPFIPSLPTP